MEKLEKKKDGELCRHFVRQRCGGCSFLHVPYATQLDTKRAHVAEIVAAALRKLPAGIRPDTRNLVKPTVPSAQELGHRASAKFCLHEDGHGRQAVGLYQQGSNVVIDTTDCPANVGLANEVVRRLFADRAALPAAFYDHQNPAFQKNRLKFATIRTSPSGGGLLADAAVILSHTGVDRGAMVGWLDRAGLSGLCVYESRLTKACGDGVTGPNVSHVSGPMTFPYKLDDDVFAISPASFFQANHGLAPTLIRAATAFAEDGQALLDLYGGFGAYSFHVRHRFKEVIVIDGNKAAISALNRHAQDVGALHVKGFASFCEDFLATLSTETTARVTHVIVNPSRSGLSPEVCGRLAPKTFPALKAVHYVSCSPATFARDAEALIRAGFTLASLEPFDMFPHADHVEVVGIFRVGTLPRGNGQQRVFRS